MIRLFFKENGIWYFLYLALSGIFLLSFYLHRLPVAYFLTSFIFAMTVLVILTLGLLFRFHQKMLALRHFQSVANLENIRFLQAPTDLIYQEIISDLIRKEADTALINKTKQENLQQMVKLWSHQMKVPLATLSLMEQTDSLDKNQVKGQILRLENDLARLINYVKLNQNQSDFRFEKISVRQLLVDLIKKNQILCHQKDLSITIDGDWFLKTDKKWLSFALSQLLDNAIKYNKQGGSIFIKIAEGAISMRDTGIGILPEDIPRLFEEGFTGYNGHENQKATGLGLAMAKKIFDQLNFQISLSSQIDQGTQVEIGKSK